MKQSPSNLKFKKYHKPGSAFLVLKDQKTFYPMYGTYALKSLVSGKLTFRQIEAGRKSIRRNIDKNSKMWIRVFTYASISKKPVASRMGKGKGAHHSWICPIRAGQVIYEVLGSNSAICQTALLKAADKLPFKTAVVKICY